MIVLKMGNEKEVYVNLKRIDNYWELSQGLRMGLME